jgi:hypothetical protein
MKRRLGWIGPAIVAVGAAVAVLGAWYVVHARPEAGAVIDTIVVDNTRQLIVRAEAGGTGDRAFIELRDGGELKWQALIPRYAGRPGAHGVGWSPTAISVRVIRDGHAEIFALAAHDASKLATLRLAPEHPDPVVIEATGPVTLTDHVRSYELVAGKDWHQLVALDLQTGKGAWSRELGPAAIQAGGLFGDFVWVRQGTAPRLFHVATGEPATDAEIKFFESASRI